jgi:enoyl-CoA hydratase/carnithine racemase
VPDDATTSTETTDDLLAVRDGPVLTLTINRPERRNAMTWDVIAGLRRELASAKVDPAVRVVVLAGAGDQAFCAGADLSGMVPKDPGGTSDEYFDHHLARGWLAQPCTRAMVGLPSAHISSNSWANLPRARW